MDVHTAFADKTSSTGKIMKTLVDWLAHRLWPFVFCLLLYVAVIGPELISAASTLAVLVGLALLAVLLAWAYLLLRRGFTHKE
jgi:membrane protein DedA with SNARE-associated domain